MTKIERDREMTEEKLINAVGELIIEGGFESLDGLIHHWNNRVIRILEAI